MARQVTWYPPGSTGLGPIVLTDGGAGLRVGKGSRGLGAVKRDLITEDSPWADGTEVEGDFAVPRRVLLPMMLSGSDRDEFLARLANLAAAMRTRTSPGELELQQADGRRFRVACHYLDGLPDEETIERGGDTNWCRFALELLAPDPYWYSPDPIVARWTYPAPVAFLASPVIPLKISSAAVLGSTTIVNPGSEYAHAVWRIAAPGTDITLTNVTTGESLRVTSSITGGQTLTIVTKPGQQNISLQPAGTDWWPYLADGGTLWTIPPGTTDISISVTGSNATTVAELEFKPRFGAPW